MRKSFLSPLVSLIVLVSLFVGQPASAQESDNLASEQVEAVLAPPQSEVGQGDAEAEPAAEKKLPAWQQSMDDAFGSINKYVSDLVFYPLPFYGNNPAPPRGADELLVANDENGNGVLELSEVEELLEGFDAPEITPSLIEDQLDTNSNGQLEPNEIELLSTMLVDADGSHRTVPFAVIWLICGAVFFTFRMGFINLRAFRHAIDVVRGKYSDPNDKSEGEVTHFQALSAALSATVGLGNIAGVAIAISVGGPGATFWMIAAGLLGMSSKFVECTLGQKYREVRADGHVMGGAMYYLSRGLGEMGLGMLGKPLAVLFAVLCIGGSIAGGNSFQVNQSLGAVGATIPYLAENGWIYGLLMTIAAGLVIIGGIKRIASVAGKIVPSMCAIYVLAALAILFVNYAEVPAAFSKIIQGAFNPDAALGGFIGVLIIGFQRAAFSNEAGVGSAAIAHSAAKTDYPVREGIVALLEPFIDTVVVCTMTALVIVITGAYENPEYAHMVDGNNGAALTSAAMNSEIPGFQYVLAVAVALFAFSSMISWFYYGERCWSYLFGEGTSFIFKLIFLTFTFLGSILSATNILSFGDTMIMAMCVPNILGLFLLSGKVRRDLTEYWDKYEAGDLPTYK